jgi:hypothetical protein
MHRCLCVLPHAFGESTLMCINTNVSCVYKCTKLHCILLQTSAAQVKCCFFQLECFYVNWTWYFCDRLRIISVKLNQSYNNGQFHARWWAPVNFRPNDSIHVTQLNSRIRSAVHKGIVHLRSLFTWRTVEAFNGHRPFAVALKSA